MIGHLVDAPIDLAALLAETADDASGALAMFVGTVRRENEGRPVEAVTYEAYGPLARRVLGELEIEAIAKHDIRACRVVHRAGRLGLGEASVAIVVRAAHRAAAFEALRYTIEELKRRVPVWKREHYASGESRHLDGVALPVPEADGR